MNYTNFINYLDQKGIKVTKRAIQYWINKKRNKSTKIHYIETRGRKKKISIHEYNIILGFCYDTSKKRNHLAPEIVRKFIKTSFNIDFSYEWCRLFLIKERFSLKVTNYRQRGYEYNCQRRKPS